MLVHKKDGAFFRSFVYRDDDKAIKSVYPKTQEAMDRLSQELRILSSLNSPYFVKPISARKHKDCYRIVTQWVEHEELTDPETFLEGLDELETALLNAKIRHRDIRSPNIIVNNNKPVLIDFGWAIHANETDMFDQILPYVNDHEQIKRMKEILLGAQEPVILP